MTGTPEEAKGIFSHHPVFDGNIIRQSVAVEILDPLGNVGHNGFFSER
jgi:hypothetical protein